MKLLFTLLFAGSVLIAAPVTQVSLTNAGSPLMSDGSYYVGPYTLQINRANTPVMCVDFLDESSVGDHWSANISTVGGDISKTYHPGDTVQYEEEAYLFAQIIKPNADRQDIQHAAWAITDSSYSINSAAQSWVNLAMQNYQSISFQNYEIISDVYQGNGKEQEFMTMVASPEPAPAFLLSGCFGAAFFLLGVKKKWRKS